VSAESYLCKISQTIILRINLILVLIIDKIKCKQVGIQQILKFTAFFPYWGGSFWVRCNGLGIKTVFWNNL